MDDRFLNYYERELTFIRAMAAEFAAKYPKIAGRLLLEPDKCEDPHTERLIEAFAFISGRIRQKIDDDFPEITQSLLNILYPHYVNPIPSMSIVRFEPVKKTLSPVGYRIERGTSLFSRPVNGIPCQFATCYSVGLRPLEVVGAELSEPRKQLKGAQQVVSIRLKTFNNLNLSQLAWDDLRFFLNGPGQHVFHLYELLLNHVCHIECEWTDGQGRAVQRALPLESIHPVGFDPNEQLIPYPGRSFPGYLLLFEYFSFPEKFLFVDLKGLDKACQLSCGDNFEIRFYFDRIARSNLVVDEDTFQLHCTPAVNLFHRIAEPVRIERKKPEYRVIPDIRRQEGTEVLSIDRITALSPSAPGKEAEFSPIYSIRHRLGEKASPEDTVFWHHHRRPSGIRGDDGTEVFLSFVDSGLKPSDPGVEVLTVHVTCTNRDLPSRLPFGDRAGDFDMEVAAPVSRITSVIKPTPARRPFLGGALHWQLISHLALNYMSIVEGGEEPLKEILRLYDFDRSPAVRQQIDGIVSLRTDHVTRRIGRSFCRGVEVVIEFDEEKYVGAGVFLFSSILERFLGQYVSVNSFSQLTARALQRKEAMKKWPPRNGSRILL